MLSLSSFRRKIASAPHLFGSFGRHRAPRPPPHSSVNTTLLPSFENEAECQYEQFGSFTRVWVCDPRHVCTAATCFGFLMSEMSKILTPRKRSFCAAGRRRFFSFSAPAGGGGSGGNPCAPQSRRPFGISTDMNSRFLYTDTSPCPPGHTSEVSNVVFAGLEMSKMFTP